MIFRERSRRAAGLEVPPFYRIVVKLVALTAVSVALALLFNTNRGSFIKIEGMPFAVPMVFGVLGITPSSWRARSSVAICTPSEATEKRPVAPASR
jgi:ABC-type xylose transport system permease subunit